jgi:integrase
MFAIEVVRQVCPASGRDAVSLWHRGVPISAANSFLRSLDDSEPTTTRVKAYLVRPFFQFLLGRRHDFDGQGITVWAANHIDFWSMPIAETVGEYRKDLLRRVAAAQLGYGRLKHRSADRHLLAVSQLLEHWNPAAMVDFLRPEARPYPGSAGRGIQHFRRRLKPFRILTPGRFRRKPNKTLPLDIYHAVWQFLEHRQPTLPPSLEQIVLDPSQKSRASAEARTYDRQLMLYLRDLGIWSLFFAAGLRNGEIVRIRACDFFRKIETGSRYVRIVDRNELPDAALGSLKSGPGEVFIDHTNRFLVHIDRWLTQGLGLAAERRRETGVQDHPMFFSNADGSPLTRSAVVNLFRRIDRHLGITSRGIYFSPHATRHTIAALFRSRGVSTEYRRWFLRHRSVGTTENYGEFYEEAIRRAPWPK